MADDEDNGRVAVLVDCDNTTPAPVKKRRPKALLDAVALMAESTSDGIVGQGNGWWESVKPLQ